MRNLLLINFFLINIAVGFSQYTSRDSTGKTYINFNSLDEALTCDSIQNLIRQHGSIENIPDADLRLLAIMGQLKCTVGMLNQLSATLQDTSIHQYQAQVLLTEDSIGNPRVLFNLMDLQTLNSARDYAHALVDFAPVLLAGQTGLIGDLLLQSGIATALSKYTIDAYYQGALKSDPLIILYPAVIPARKLSKEVVNELRKNKVFNEFTNNWQQNVSGVMNPIAKLGKEKIKMLARETERVSRQTTEATEKVISAVKEKTRLKSK